MNVEISKTSGFCMGVSNVVSVVESLLAKGKKVCTLGPIIHNPKVIENLENRGVKIISKALEYDNGYTLIIRSHGVTKSELEYIKNSGFDHIDATCPFVKKIHKIVSKYSDKSDYLFIAGDKNHPEVIGIRSYFSGESFIFKDIDELKMIIKNHDIPKDSKILVASQTTYDFEKWGKSSEFISKELPNALVFNTICSTTGLRQQEAKELSKKSDLMIVIGGKTSSNTFKLYDICSKKTKTIWIESADELQNIDFKAYENIGIVAGASTPRSEINKTREMICIL